LFTRRCGAHCNTNLSKHYYMYAHGKTTWMTHAMMIAKAHIPPTLYINQAANRLTAGPIVPNLDWRQIALIKPWKSLIIKRQAISWLLRRLSYTRDDQCMRRTPQIVRNINNMRIKPVEVMETAIAGLDIPCIQGAFRKCNTPLQSGIPMPYATNICLGL
jgi:hypothetical protein